MVAGDRPVMDSDAVDEEEKVEYDWQQEWYPMYLEAEMPKASPLGLTVFDRSLVLFYDGDGELHCFEDRCPHRFVSYQSCSPFWFLA